MQIINAMFISSMVGVIIAIPAIISEIFRRGKNLPILMDVDACWGRKCTDGEIFVFSLFTHLILAIAFGGVYMFLVLMDWGFHGFDILEISIYSFLYFVIVGVIILPIVRLGFFGSREGRWVWLELFISYALQAVGFWAAFQLFPVFLS